MVADLRDPSRVQVTGRVRDLHPRSIRAQKIRRGLAVAAFFGSLIAFFVFLIWLANRFPAAPSPPRRAYRGEVK